jgi:hypothetical protein
MTIIGNNINNIFDKRWLFIDKYGRKEFQKFPTSINILPKQDYNGSFGRNTFGKGDSSQQMASECSWTLPFIPMESILPGTLHCEVCQKTIDRPISRRKHI